MERICSSLCWKLRLFPSFQIMETTANHNILNTKHIFLDKPPKPQNWFRCAIKFRENSEEIPNQPQITYQMQPKKSQETTKWSLSSLHLDPLVQSCSSMVNTYLLSKLSLVGSRLSRKRQANKETFNGTTLNHNIWYISDQYKC